jgi:hypothetical protein
MCAQESNGLATSSRARVDIAATIAILALVLSGISFYRTYIYTKQQLDITVTEVSYVTNQGELYVTVAFSNSGNRDGALLRVEPAVWGRRGTKDPEWIPLVGKVHADIPLTGPKMPIIVKAGGVEVVTLSAKLNPADAEEAQVAPRGAAFLGIRVATMNSDGNLFLVQHPVAKLSIDGQGRIQSAEPAIHASLHGFLDLDTAPPGDTQQWNRKTPFVWADAHY